MVIAAYSQVKALCQAIKEVGRMDHPTGTFSVKAGLAKMLKGGVIMDVVTPEQARIAEDSGACAEIGRAHV